VRGRRDERINPGYDDRMPELPEVETVARGLARTITGRVIAHVELTRTDIVHGEPVPIASGLRGLLVEAVERCGKHIRIRLGDLSLHVHLGMTGRLVVVERSAPVEPHTHLRIGFAEGSEELRFCDPRRFGGLWIVRQSGPSPGWTGRRLPPVHADPLKLTFAEFRALLQRRRQIKALLLDQDPISGIGNIYCDESLHRARIHPLTLADRLDDAAVRRLWTALRRVLAEAIAAGGSSISDYRSASNEPGWFQTRHRVYDRAGKPCRRCGTRIVRFVAAGRGTFICPKCQRRPG
jgi:formamidopyrimidine-DNA glycosylase